VIHVAAILARGLGSRMRRDDGGVVLDAAQAARAADGLKAMIPIGRPFLDYVISALADAGITEVVLVIGPDHTVVRDYFTVVAPPTRVRLRFAVQEQPLGTADAVVAAAGVIGAEPFLVLNADNRYPPSAVRALAAQETAGVVAFDRDALIADGAIDVDRIRQFAILDVGPNNLLRDIVEKPGDALDPGAEQARWVSMNLWAVTPSLIDACRRVPLSRRGEYELPEAIALAVGQGEHVRVVYSHEGVLDLSHRRDIAQVAERLRGTPVYT